MRVVSSQEMRIIEKKTIEEIGFNEDLIIENIGVSGADFVEDNLSDQYQFSEIVVLVGPGSNGADGLSMARHLANRGHTVRAFMLFGQKECSAELQKQALLAKNFGVKISEVTQTLQLESYFTQAQNHYLVIDAILGTGLRLPLSNYIFDVINLVSQFSTITVAIDVPTGVSADTGMMNGNAIEADYTLTIGLPKVGLFVGPGTQHIGEVVVIDAGFPNKLLDGGDKALLTKESVVSFYGGRNKWAHKNTFGHCLIVGGSPGLTGALIMASKAALKVGTGLVTASTWEDSYPELCTRVIPEVMTGLIPTNEGDVEDIIGKLQMWDSIVIGPGLGISEQSRETLMNVLNHFAGPVVVDADAIKLLSFKEDAQVIAQRKWPTVFTPHMGEFAHFIGLETQKVLERPLDYLKEVVDQCNCCFVMKGPSSYLGFPNGITYINHFPNDGMASGGSGDVLAGILGGLLAQYPMEKKSSAMFADKSVVYNSIRLGIVAHTLAGKFSAEKLGARSMIAGSIIDHLTDAFREIEDELLDS